MTYEQSLQQLETIVRKMEAGDYSIDELTQQLATAQQLIARCKEQLTRTDADIQKLLTTDENP